MAVVVLPQNMMGTLPVNNYNEAVIWLRDKRRRMSETIHQARYLLVRCKRGWMATKAIPLSRFTVDRHETLSTFRLILHQRFKA
jgi:hypothetical protein